MCAAFTTTPIPPVPRTLSIRYRPSTTRPGWMFTPRILVDSRGCHVWKRPTRRGSGYPCNNPGVRRRAAAAGLVLGLGACGDNLPAAPDGSIDGTPDARELGRVTVTVASDTYP